MSILHKHFVMHSQWLRKEGKVMTMFIFLKIAQLSSALFLLLVFGEEKDGG
jgi:hypothetical protein